MEEKMQEIINKIIEIDNNAKSIIKQEKEKKDNFEDFVNSQFNTKKAILDLEYKDEINKKQQEYSDMLAQKKENIINDVKQEISEIEKNYRQVEQNLIEDIVNRIKNGEE